MRAFDGAENIEEVTDGAVGWADLTEPQSMQVADWVMSVEVAEHIPSALESVYIQNLHAHNRRGIFISWGVPGQYGHHWHHINLRDNGYVVSLFEGLGYVFDEALSKELRSASSLHWMKNTIFVFRRK